MNNFRFKRTTLATVVLLATGASLSGCSDDDKKVQALICEAPQVLNGDSSACIYVAPYATDLYLKGAFSGWGVEDAYKLTFKAGNYYLDNVEFLAGVPEFKISDALWALDTTFTVDLENLTQVEPNQTYPLQTGDGAANMALLIEEKGLYDFKLEIGEDSLHPTFSFVQDMPPLSYQLYIRGGFNGWSTDNEVKYIGDNVYQVVMKVAPGNYEFKLASADWGSEWVLSEEDPITAELETEYSMVASGPNATLFAPETAYYKFIFNATDTENPIFSIVETDGSEGVEIDPHEGRENIQKTTFTTFDDKEESVTFSADDIAATYRDYAQSTTQDLRDPGDAFTTYKEKEGQPTIRTGNLSFDALFSLSVNESELNSVSEINDGNYNGGEAIDCECFETGAKWHYVWTRDLSYAAHLGLTLLDPIRVKNSLEFKLSTYRDGITKPTQAAGDDSGLQIVQDTGSGGSWPISTDRVTWAFGAEKALQNLSGEVRDTFAAKTYTALVNTIENDRIAVFDSVDGLYNGEQSFLDWREQTYASWITKDIASIGTAKALSTNAAHYQALTLTAKLALEQGETDNATKYQTWADQLKTAINSRFWLEDAGLYSSLTAGHHNLAPLHKYDWLGQSLVIITGIADDVRANKVLANYPHGDMGAPVIFPQQLETPVYHNRAIWPFVTAYGLKAAAKQGNIAVANAAYDTLLRGAALNLSNMENFEWLSLKPNLLDFDHPELTGPVINSKRQLWSVGAYVGMVVENIFGITTSDTGINISPFITSTIRKQQFADSSKINLQGLTLQGKKVNVEIALPDASTDTGYYAIDSVSLNGTVATQQMEWADLGENNDIVITLGTLISGSSDITKVTSAPLNISDASVFAPKAPLIQRVFINENAKVAVEFSDTQTGGINYNIYRDGKLLLANVEKGIVTDSLTEANAEGHCYAVEAYYTSSNNYSHHSEPVCYATAQNIAITDARVDSNVNVTAPDDLINRDYLHNWGKLEDTLTVTDISLTSGDFALQLQYHNNFNAINLGVTNGVKWVNVKNSNGDIVAQGIVQMPHAQMVDGKKPLVYSTPLAIHATAGTYSVEITDFYNMGYMKSNELYGGSGGINGAINQFDLTEIRIQPDLPLED